jgi:hypothetical protein
MGASGGGRERMRLQVQGYGKIKFQVDPEPGGASDTWAYSVCLPNNEWQHIAVTFDGNRTGKIYCGGVLAGTGTSHDPGISSLNYDLYIGSDFSDSNRFQGAIDQVRLSNVARTSFPQAQFAKMTLPPSVATGDLMPVPVSGQPNLKIHSLRTYPNITGGSLIEVVVQNTGSQSTQNGFYTDLYFDHQPTGADDYTNSLDFWVNDPIEAGQTVTLTTVITTSQTSRSIAGDTSGVLYAQVDSAGSVSESDDADNIYSSGADFCLGSPDGYEGDEAYTAASLIAPSQIQSHNFDRLNDQDWLKFAATKGDTYVLETTNLALAADTYLYLYDRNGTTVLTTNDDNGDSLASRLEWVAPSSGTYYILIRHWNPNVGGCSTSYDFKLTKETPPTATPVPTATPAPTATPVSTSTPAPTTTPVPTATPVKGRILIFLPLIMR